MSFVSKLESHFPFNQQVLETAVKSKVVIVYMSLYFVVKELRGIIKGDIKIHFTQHFLLLSSILDNYMLGTILDLDVYSAYDYKY